MRTITKIMVCAGRIVTQLHTKQTVDAPGTQTVSVRVGVCPLFDGKQAFCGTSSRTYDHEHRFLRSFFTKDG